MRRRFATNQKCPISVAVSAIESNESSTSYSGIRKRAQESTSTSDTSCPECFPSQLSTQSRVPFSTSSRLHTAAANPGTGGLVYRIASKSFGRARSEPRAAQDAVGPTTLARAMKKQRAEIVGRPSWYWTDPARADGRAARGAYRTRCGRWSRSRATNCARPAARHSGLSRRG